jgi:hypothetical protein
LVFGLFFALLIVCAVRGVALHAAALWRKFRRISVGAKQPAERLEMPVATR